MTREKIILFLFFLLFKGTGAFFLNERPEEKARKYLKLSLSEYKKAIKENPNNEKVVNEYVKLLEAIIGKTEAKIELALIFKEIGFDVRVSELLLDISLKDRENAILYLEKRVEQSKDIIEKINLYYLLTEISPQNPLYWYNLGKLLIGINKEDEGILALQKAHKYNFKDITLFYYLAIYEFNKGNFKKAKSYIYEGLEISDDILLHKILLKIYLMEGDKEMANLEKEKIKNLMAKKEEREIEKKGLVEKEEKKKIVKKEKIEGLNPYIFLGVSKNEQKLYVVKFDGYSFNIIKEYKCTTGPNMGDKEKKGDKKTPEGAYLLISKLEGPSLPSKYGICAYPLNFPDPIDKRLNKDGDGIWLHATPIERPPYNSEGCVVVNDKDMQELTSYINVGKTFICISKEKSFFLNFPYLKEIKNTVENWRKAWESKDIDKYIEFYDENFFSDGKNKSGWKAYKEKINKKKKYIKVDISDLQILPYKETKFGYMTVAFFKQNYKSDNFSSKTRKILYLVKRNGNWKIICEKTL